MVNGSLFNLDNIEWFEFDVRFANSGVVYRDSNGVTLSSSSLLLDTASFGCFGKSIESFIISSEPVGYKTLKTFEVSAIP